MVRVTSSRTRQIVQHFEIRGIPPQRCNDQTRLLRVRVIRALDLMKKDIFGASDPYCKILLYKNNRTTNCLCPPVQTKTIKRSLNPIWNEEVIFRVNPFENRLVFELYDENRLTRDDFLGVVTVSLPHLEIGTEETGQRLVPKSFMLHPRSSRSRVRGNLHLYLVYLPDHINPRITTVQELPPPRLPVEPNSPTTPDLLSSSLHRPSLEQVQPNLPDVAGSDLAESPPTFGGERESDAGRGSIVGASSALSLEDTSSVELVADPLPPGWDERVDQNGRTYYVDHVNRRTQWDRPSFQLPEGWEQRTDANGRVYYVDHINHVTTWYHPLSEAARVHSTPSRSSLDAGSYSDADSHHSAEENAVVEDTEMTEAGSPSSAPLVNSTGPCGSASPALVVSDMRDSRRRAHPIRRSFTMADGGSTEPARSRQTRPTLANQAMDEVRAAQTMYLRRRQVSLEDTLSHSPTGGSETREQNSQPSTLTPRRDDPEPDDEHTTAVSPDAASSGVAAQPEDEPGNQTEQRAASPRSNAPQRPSSASEQGIVLGINVEPGEEALPAGWQVARTAGGRRFFINHNEQRTTWDDPRTHRSTSQGNVGSLLKQDAERHSMKDLGPLPPGWEERVHTNGRIFYINHNARTTQWEDPRLERLGGPAVPYSRNYKQKYDFFRSRLRSPRDPQAKLELRIARPTIFEDSFRQIYGIKKPEYLMHRCIRQVISNEDEAGLLGYATLRSVKNFLLLPNKQNMVCCDRRIFWTRLDSI
ncbi:hypothetical protein CRM22_010496 [Opisthorchis felineus]|uniref:HECT-type E3 ubiquitin transferase n=1 Tax=Opisthorchis felineus TaxID=147828 RepID=A0A4S2KXR6_OPIFE|nr:hypothetical protein CRM22_010496 [Opisthorchis felineus]